MGILSFRLVTTEEDTPALVSLAKQAHKESRFSGIDFSSEKVRRLADAARHDQARHGVMLALRGEEPIGFCYCSIGEFFVGVEALIATVHVLWVKPDVRASLSGGRAALGLMRGIETWSQARNAREILLHVTSAVSLPRTQKLFNRVGYKVIGGNYAKKL